MSDFVSGFWSWYVALLALVAIIACIALLRSHKTGPAAGAPKVHGHVWDEDLAEYNNPLPRWWMWMFYATIAFALVYLLLYPGLGSFAGLYGWTSRGQYQAEAQQAESQYGPIFNKFAEQDLAVLADDPEARAVGGRLFLVYCSQCHGSDAGGGFGFPNLRDKDWLYGGDPQTVKDSIMNGRAGVMPAHKVLLGEAKVHLLAAYVYSLSVEPGARAAQKAYARPPAAKQ